MTLERSVLLQLEESDQTAGPADGHAHEPGFPERAHKFHSFETLWGTDVQTVTIAIVPRQ
jgi:hypothetical protein